MTDSKEKKYNYLGWHFHLTNSGKVIQRFRTQNKKTGTWSYLY